MTPSPPRLAGWSLPRIGLGTGTWAHDAAIPQAHWDELVACVLAGPEPFIDTAALYGAGLSEQRLGAALRGVPRQHYRLASKAGWDTRSGTPRNDFSRDFIRRSVEASLGRLGLEHLDIVHVHDPDCCPRQALDEAFPALYALREQGVIGAVGAGMNQWHMLADFARQADVDCFLLAGRYTLLEQTALPLLDLCAEKGLTLFLGGVYNSGILATGPVPGARHNYAPAPPEVLERARRLADACARHGVALSAAALQFALAHPAVRTLVIGCNTPAEFNAALTGVEAPIPAALWADLRAAGLVAADAPAPTAVNREVAKSAKKP
jgi:D-threo-aldose 1-dehydrogenase